MSGLLVVAFACSLAACKKDPEVISLSGKTMGTTYHVKYIDDGSVSENLQNTHEQIEYILKDVNAKMSTYIKDSELSRFNQNTQVNTPIEISADFAKVLAEAIQLHQVTEGALDVTVGPVVNLWGFGPEKRPERQPTAEQLAERQAWVGLDKITLDMSGNIPTLSKSVPQVYIDLSSIAKGFGVDQVAEKLEQLNAQTIW
ncbi:thiamine biosynthesis lipoprotein ApbE [Rodentibacter pneumotropicus]|uniref:FAD:protein FMN transferase n=1 Tax=Rodentibacter pneumotropicus TaxID=758 RepID=A0A448MKI9_9PAST|nr:thiamine biosynthesis lipoprotein ApbE [Rodentibacter pneumotropicus]